MVESTIWLRELIENYSAIEYLLVFVGTAVGGDFLLIALAFLSAQGLISVPVLLVFSFLGTFFSDILLFLLARTTFLHNIISHRYAHRTASVIVESLLRTGRRNHFLSLTIAKFLVATRVVIMLYADKTDISFKKFFYANAAATFVWVVAVVPIGFTLGLGFTYFSEVFKNIYAGIGLVVLLLVLLGVGEVWLEKKFTHPAEK